MEEKKLDLNSIIGFVLIFGILIFMFYQNQPTPEEVEAEKAKQEQVEAAKASENLHCDVPYSSEANRKEKSKLGVFGWKSNSI